MAITSVARKATIKPDNTFLKVQQLVGQQKAVAQKLELEQQKQAAARKKADNEATAESLKRITDTDPVPPHWLNKQQEDARKLNTELLDPNIDQEVKEGSILRFKQYSDKTNSFWGDYVTRKTQSMENEDEKNEFSANGMDAVTADYVDDKIDDPTLLNSKEHQVALESDMRSYNYNGLAKSYQDSIEDTVGKVTEQSTRVGGIGTMITTNRKSGDFLALEGGEIKYNEDGSPEFYASPESVNAWRKYSKGNEAYFQNYKANNPKGTGIDAMKQYFQEYGDLTLKDTSKDTIVKDTASDKGSGGDPVSNAQKRHARYVKDLFSEGATGKEALGILQGVNGVIDQPVEITEKVIKRLGDEAITREDETTTTKTQVIDKGDEWKFVIVFDKNQTQLVKSELDTPEARENIALSDTKVGKYTVRTFTVDKKDPEKARQGFIQLSRFQDRTLGTKFEVNPTDLMGVHDEWMKNLPDKGEEIDFGFNK